VEKLLGGELRRGPEEALTNLIRTAEASAPSHR